MSNKTCVILKKAKSLASSVQHNREHKKLDYVKQDGLIMTSENQIIVDLNQDELHKFEREQISELQELIKEKTGRKSQVQNFYVDGLLSLGREVFDTLNEDEKIDLANTCAHFVTDFADKHNVNLMHVSAHFDEGHTDENGKWQDNAHIQFCFENINRDTGKAVLSRLTKKDLQNLQTEFAKCVSGYGFERGINYASIGEKAPKQIYWKDYKRQKLQEEQKKSLELTQTKNIVINSLKTANATLKEQIISEMRVAFDDPNLKTLDDIKESYIHFKEIAIEYNKKNQDDKLNRENYYKELETLKKAKESQANNILKLTSDLKAKDNQINQLIIENNSQEIELTRARSFHTNSQLKEKPQNPEVIEVQKEKFDDLMKDLANSLFKNWGYMVLLFQKNLEKQEKEKNLKYIKEAELSKLAYEKHCEKYEIKKHSNFEIFCEQFKSLIEEFKESIKPKEIER